MKLNLLFLKVIQFSHWCNLRPKQDIEIFNQYLFDKIKGTLVLFKHYMIKRGPHFCTHAYFIGRLFDLDDTFIISKEENKNRGNS